MSMFRATGRKTFKRNYIRVLKNEKNKFSTGYKIPNQADVVIIGKLRHCK